MDAIYELSWRAYPAFAPAAAGAVMVVRGLRLAREGLGDPDRNLLFMRGFRSTVIGLALTGVAAAWAWHLPWLLILSLAIGGEETLESSIHAYAIRRGIRLRAERSGVEAR